MTRITWQESVDYLTETFKRTPTDKEIMRYLTYMLSD